MALIECPECGSEVSSEAAACPKCAFPVKKSDVNDTEAVPNIDKGQARNKRLLWAGSLAMAVLVGAGYLFTDGASSSERNVPALRILSKQIYTPFVGLPEAAVSVVNEGAPTAGVVFSNLGAFYPNCRQQFTIASGEVKNLRFKCGAFRKHSEATGLKSIIVKRK